MSGNQGSEKSWDFFWNIVTFCVAFILSFEPGSTVLAENMIILKVCSPLHIPRKELLLENYGSVFLSTISSLSYLFIGLRKIY